MWLVTIVLLKTECVGTVHFHGSDDKSKQLFHTVTQLSGGMLTPVWLECWILIWQIASSYILPLKSMDYKLLSTHLSADWLKDLSIKVSLTSYLSNILKNVS